jgi:hypothetical protein
MAGEAFGVKNHRVRVIVLVRVMAGEATDARIVLVTTQFAFFISLLD